MIVVGKLNNFWREDLDARIAIKILGSAPHAKTAGLCALVGLPNWGVYITCAVYGKNKEHVKFKGLVSLYTPTGEILR